MARKFSHQKGRIEQRERRHGLVYVLRYRLRQGGEWVEKTEELGIFKSPKEAQAAADRRMLEINYLNNNPKASITIRSITMAEFAEGLWQHHKSKVKASTAYHYDSMMRLYVLPEFGQKRMLEIDSEAITSFFVGLEQKQLSCSYRLVIYQLLKTLFEIALAYKKIEANPVNPKLHRPTLERKEKPTLTADEIRRVIEAVRPEHRPLFYCLALTGLRIGELLGLRWGDVDFDTRRLTVARSLWRRQLMTPKTSASKRRLHLPSALLEVLQMQHEASAWTGPDDFVFAKADGAPLSADTLRICVLFPALEAAGIRRQKSAHGFHLFRHSAASIVHAQTRDMSLAQELLGHSRLSTTADIYTHTRSAAEQATETLAREIFGNCGLTVAETSTQVN